MRGADQQQSHIFSYLSPEERVRKDHPLRPIPAMVDEVLKQLSRRFDAMYAKVGPSGVTLKPTNGGQGKTGQRKWPGTKLFYPAASC
jgi:hypothetical protein